MLIRLDDDTPVVVRPIRADDKGLLGDGLSHLSEASRQQRFLGAKTRFTAAELRYLTEVDGIDHVAYVALRGDAPRELVAVARLVRDAERPDTAEVAIVIADRWQRKGLGRRLGDLLATAARDRGVRWIIATMSADNRGAHRVLEHISSQLEHERVGAVDELCADLAAA